MKEDDWSLDGKNSELQRDIPSKLEILNIEPKSKNEVDKVIEDIKTNFFTGRFGISGPKKSDVKVSKTDVKFYPYLIVEGIYAVRFLRRNDYQLKINPDVVSVKIKDQILNVDNKPFTLSSLIAKGASGLTIGGTIGFSFDGLEDVMQKGMSKVLGDRDVQLMNDKSIRVPDLLEHAVYEKKKIACFDASTANIVEKSDILRRIKKGTNAKDGRPKNHKETLDFKKAIKYVEDQIVKVPNGRVLEQIFKISKLSMIFLPRIHIELQYKNKKENVILDGITLDEFKDGNKKSGSVFNFI